MKKLCGLLLLTAALFGSTGCDVSVYEALLIAREIPTLKADLCAAADAVGLNWCN